MEQEPMTADLTHTHRWIDGELLLNGCALPHAARPSDDLMGLREALYKVAGSITDARVAELMRAASIPLHGHPIHNEAGYVAGVIRAEIKIGVDAALARLEPGEGADR